MKLYFMWINTLLFKIPVTLKIVTETIIKISLNKIYDCKKFPKLK